MALVGFSLGGNVVLKYLGQRGNDSPRTIGPAVVFSVPCDLHGAAIEMSRPSNMIYMRRFLTSVHDKIRVKVSLFPGRVDDRDSHRMRDLNDFDDHYTGSLHGFVGAVDYWEKPSSDPFLGSISVATLLVNALDDHFLAPSCYLRDKALKNSFLTLEMPRAGGHVRLFRSVPGTTGPKAAAKNSSTGMFDPLNGLAVTRPHSLAGP